MDRRPSLITEQQMSTVSDQPLSVKLRPWLEEELRNEFEERGESISEGLRRLLEEWWAVRNLPAIEFRDGVGGRRAAVRNGPEVWEIVSVYRDYAGDVDALHEHFSWLDEEALDAVLEYYDRFPEAIDMLIQENERTARFLADRIG